jgi:hypothetical protein
VGKKRRTKAEMAEDAAVGIGSAPGETSEEDEEPQVQQAAPQQGFGEAPQGGFGQAPQQQAAPIQQPASQPQVVTGDLADAFAGWDD